MILANVNGNQHRGRSEGEGDHGHGTTRAAGHPKARVRDGKGSATGSSVGAPGLQGLRRDRRHEGAVQGTDVAPRRSSQRPRTTTRPGLGPVRRHLRYGGRGSGKTRKADHPSPMAEVDGTTSGNPHNRITGGDPATTGFEGPQRAAVVLVCPAHGQTQEGGESLCSESTAQLDATG